MLKISLLLQTLWVNNTVILRIKNAKFLEQFLDERKHKGRYSNLHQCTFVSLFLFTKLLLICLTALSSGSVYSTYLSYLDQRNIEFPNRIQQKPNSIHSKNKVYIKNWERVFAQTVKMLKFSLQPRNKISVVYVETLPGTPGTSKIESFATILTGFQQFPIVAKLSILKVCEGPGCFCYC